MTFMNRINSAETQRVTSQQKETFGTNKSKNKQTKDRINDDCGDRLNRSSHACQRAAAEWLPLNRVGGRPTERLLGINAIKVGPRSGEDQRKGPAARITSSASSFAPVDLSSRSSVPNGISPSKHPEHQIPTH